MPVPQSAFSIEIDKKTGDAMGMHFAHSCPGLSGAPTSRRPGTALGSHVGGIPQEHPLPNGRTLTVYCSNKAALLEPNILDFLN